jgi:MFS family permease
MRAAPRTTITLLGLAQTLSWASSYYLPALLAPHWARDLGFSLGTVMAGFSGALLIAALVGPAVGRWIDQQGGRGLLLASNGLFAAGLLTLALAHSTPAALGAVLLLGLAMGIGLYETAFASLVHWYRHDARRAITGITLIAGFASTVGWPLTGWMTEQFGWRNACLGWAALQLLVGLPLNFWLPRGPAAAQTLAATATATATAIAIATATAAAAAAAAATATATATVTATAHGTADVSAAPAGPLPLPTAAASGPTGDTKLRGTMPVVPSAWRTLVLLALTFAALRFVSTGVGSQLPALLMALGGTMAAAVAAGAFMGPAQVGGRLLEFGALQRLSPVVTARLAALGPLTAAAALLLVGLPAAVPFALLHGAGNGILTISKGTLPLVLMGPQGYGARQGWLNLPATAVAPLAPWIYGLALERSAQAALALSCAASALAVMALILLHKPSSRA